MAIEISGIPQNASPLSPGDKNETTESRRNTQSVDAGSSHASTKNTAQANVQPARVDDVTITQDARNLIKIEADVNKSSEIDDERVASLKQAIDSGRYNIDPAKVAEKFLQFETMLAS